MTWPNRERLAELLIEADIPQRLHEGVIAHVYDRRVTGHFLTAVFENNLFQAVGRADPECLAALRPLVQLIFCNTDGRCHGSKQAVELWLNPPF